MADTTRGDAGRIPDDDPARALTVATLDNPASRRLSVVGDTYVILVSGAQTAGRYCLIDMTVPPGGGPPPHRHDFEEMFTLVEGELDFTFRGETRTVGAGTTVNVPANAPHVFRNNAGRPARMLCLCVPAGQDAFFEAVGIPLEGRAEPGDAERAEQAELMLSLMPRYGNELLGPEHPPRPRTTMTESEIMNAAPTELPFGEAWVAAYFEDVDRLDPAALLRWFEDDASFRFGGHTPVRGKAAIAEMLGAFFGTIAGMRHEKTGAWIDTDGPSAVWESSVTFTRRDGTEVALPGISVLRLSGGLIRDFRFVMDPAPIHGPAT